MAVLPNAQNGTASSQNHDKSSVKYASKDQDAKGPAEQLRDAPSREKREAPRIAAESSALKAEKRRRESVFRLRHALLLVLLSFYIILHGVGLYLFKNGFLLSRFVLNQRSRCDQPPISFLPGTSLSQKSFTHGSYEQGCWHPRTFNKAILLMIDAFRYDFAVPFLPTDEQKTPQAYHNSIPLLYETAVKHPQHAFLRPFIADPPTTTLQRLKALTTGTLPTFIDAGSNFAGTAIDEDNLIEQLVLAGRNVVHLGDDTWHSLFPGYFEPNLTRPFPSLEVWDLHTVDNGVVDNLFPILESSAPGDPRWDVLIGHFLGVDHAGHRYGPDHPAMTAKLQQMNDVISKTVNLIDEDTLLVIMGDHGMDAKGDHGGESDLEVEAAIWMYSKRPVFGRSREEYKKPPPTAKERPIGQIDLVPTLSLLLGLPIPFNNLGAPIEEAFIGANGQDWENLALVNRLAAAQIHAYQDEYALVREADPAVIAGPTRLWNASLEIERSHISSATGASDAHDWKQALAAFSAYCEGTLRIFRSLWTQFGPVSMLAGILVATLSLLALFSLTQAQIDFTGNLITLVWKSSKLLIGGALLGYSLGNFVEYLEPIPTAFFGAALSSGLFLMVYFRLCLPQFLRPLYPRSLWSWYCALCTLLLSGGFAANSFTIWEDEILLFFLATFGTLMFIQCFGIPDKEDRKAGCLYSVAFMVLVRLASLSRLCREEQSRFCRSTFYASATSSTSAPWQVLIPFVIAVTLPDVIKRFYARTQSYNGTAIFWIGVAFRSSLLLIAVFWTIDAADDGDWIRGVSKSTLKTVRMYIAQFVLVVAVGAGSATFAWQAPFIGVVSIRRRARQSNLAASSLASLSRKQGAAAAAKSQRVPPGSGAPIEVQGLRNLYGSHFAILPFTVVLIPLLLLQKPMGQYALALVSVAIFALLEILALLRKHSPHSAAAAAVSSPSTSAASLGPVVLALLGHFAFFKTGHQAALSSIQWDVAYIPTRSLRMPWSPLIVALNSFAGQILCAAAVPLTVLWRRQYTLPEASDGGGSGSGNNGTDTAREDGKGEKERANLLVQLTKAHVAHVSVYAVINLATTLWAAHLRRHLMLYRVFCPRWMLGGAALLIVELVSLGVGLGGASWSVRSVGSLFGW